MLDTACCATSPMRPLRLSAISSVLRASRPRPPTYSAAPVLGVTFPHSLSFSADGGVRCAQETRVGGG